MQGFHETWKLFQGFLQGKKVEKGWPRGTEENLSRESLRPCQGFTQAPHKQKTTAFLLEEMKSQSGLVYQLDMVMGSGLKLGWG
jgi:hypothetical protein